jgi:hypothetical protein
MARGRALAWVSRLRHALPPRTRGGEPAYNALTRRITLTDVRLAAEGFTTALS